MLRITEEVDFNEELYKKNLEENSFAELEDNDGRGDEECCK